MTRKINFKLMLGLQGAVVIYSFADICAKLASAHPFLTLPYVLWIGTEVLVLGVYALCWQQIIKKVDISVAYSNRAAAIVWTTLWAALVFHEHISVQNVLGIGILFAGIWMVNRDG
ncbi:MAG: EamA family transporter [Oscillospiraceae bacterium]|nr:EamA family transporter [Oscillospiraceae bacterium]